jgi:hypothetical protein
MRRVVVTLRAALAVALIGCAPKVHFTILDAADRVLPPDIRTIAVDDRTGVPEGTAATRGFTRWLATSDRFEVTDAGNADATVVIEGFDSESTLAVEDRLAFRSSRVVLTWRLVDRQGTLLDGVEEAATVDRWSAVRDEETAVAPLPTAEATIAALAESSGVAYARRLTAVSSSHSRDTYVRGDPRLRFARVAVRAGDWDRAMRLWTEVARSAEPAIAARAHYDLAVGYEVEGEVRRALDHLHQAAALDDGPRIARYRDALDRVNGDQRPLRPIAQEE